MKTLCDGIASTMRHAVCAYQSMSSMGAWDMPEFWLQCEIARGLRCGYFVLLEAPTTALLNWELGEKREKISGLEGGKIDLALFEQKVNPKEAHLIGLIEVKKIEKPDDCNEDVERLRELCGKINCRRKANEKENGKKIVRTALVAAHLQYADTETLGKNIVALLKNIGSPRDRAAVRKFATDIENECGKKEPRFCAAVVADVLQAEGQ